MLGRTGSGTKYDPVTDSAAAITAIATGRKTQINRLSQGPADDPKVAGDNDEYVTAMERAKQLGKRTGNVTTVDFDDASPAGQLAHISYRECFTPQPVVTPGPTVTVPGPATPGPERVVTGEPKLTVGVATPRTATADELRAGIPVSLVATRSGRATVRITRGGRTVASRSVLVKPNRSASVRLKAPAVRPGGKGTAFRVQATPRPGQETARADSALRVRR